jgi:hypothetical protein
MARVYLNSEISIIIGVIDKLYKFEMYRPTIRKPSDLFSKNYRGFGQYKPLVE